MASCFFSFLKMFLLLLATATAAAMLLPLLPDSVLA